ncbi:MAG: phosphate ABC transporter permease subunit PstC [Desulfuromonadaceae bacterium]
MIKQTNSIFDPIFRWVTLSGSLFILVTVIGILLTLTHGALPSLEKFGFGFLSSSEWNPYTHEYGALSSVYGTLVSTFIAMLIAVPLALVIALFLVELAPPAVSRLVGGAIELLAAIPSIIYGMWGLFVFAPFLADHIQPKLAAIAPGFPLFEGPPMGIGLLTAGIILALMILPFITSVTRDVFMMVPSIVKESAFGMGSTTWEVTRKVTIPYGIQGVVGACFLGLGRAIGETMAVTFVIGNSHKISASLFAAGNSIASTLANEFTEAADDIYLAALIELGLVLFGLTLVLQIIARWWLHRTAKRLGAVR